MCARSPSQQATPTAVRDTAQHRDTRTVTYLKEEGSLDRPRRLPACLMWDVHHSGGSGPVTPTLPVCHHARPACRPTTILPTVVSACTVAPSRNRSAYPPTCSCVLVPMLNLPTLTREALSQPQSHPPTSPHSQPHTLPQHASSHSHPSIQPHMHARTCASQQPRQQTMLPAAVATLRVRASDRQQPTPDAAGRATDGARRLAPLSACAESHSWRNGSGKPPPHSLWNLMAMVICR